MSFNPRIIEGKWNKKRYQVHQELGRGTTGVVYLVTHQGQAYALKLGEDTLSISAEVNVLKKYHQGTGSPIVGPAVFDVDDWACGEQIRPFYVMNVIDGKSLQAFVNERGREWVPVLMMQLLDFLEGLHQDGFVFGDLKPDNLKVSGHPPRLAWFDPGGITKIGWAIKEYTEVYDRAYWQMGDRKAEPAYDLFSLALIFLYLFTGKTMQPMQPGLGSGAPNRDTLKAAIFQNKLLAPYQEFLWKALDGRYVSSRQMKVDLLKLWFSAKQRPTKNKPTKQRSQNTQQKSKVASPSLKPKVKGGIFSTMITFFFLSSFFIFLFALYLFSQTF